MRKSGIEISREVIIPDPIKIARYARSPELGPRVLFFSGGTALKETSRFLTSLTHNSIHVMTPFDSGGSSATLREAFHMPAIGDVRNRIMALADAGVSGNPEIFELFSYRLPKDHDHEALFNELFSMVRGRHPLVAAVHDPMRKIIRRHLRIFLENMPENFDLRGASTGNLVLAAGYLDNTRMLDPVIYIFSKLVNARGIVRPVLNADIQLIAELESGEIVKGQHLLTGKETSPISSKVKRIYLSRKCEPLEETRPPIRNKLSKLISTAELICYPIGSFWSSIVANVLPEGVGKAVAGVRCPKVFVPNSLPDPECIGMSLGDQVRELVHYLRKDAPEDIGPRDVLRFVLIDEQYGEYPSGVDAKVLEEMGIQIVRAPLVVGPGNPQIDPERLSQALLSMT
jgi:CofD-related protein of GAK system